MFTKNIRFINFLGKKNKNLKKKIKKDFQSNNFLKIYPLLHSLKKDYNYSFKKNDLKNLKKFNSFNLIGMGGSTLGSQAIYDFLSFKIKKKFYFYNNLQSINRVTNRKKKINIIVSKSGNTLETISNLNYLLQRENKNKNIILAEKKNNYLTKLGKKLKAEIFEHKNYIGGRYSVLSEVGMLPSELMGLNEKKFKKYNDLIKNGKFLNSLIENVACLENFHRKGMKNSVILNYDEKSENLFKWYKQLCAESLGKKSKGIFPIISTMPKDNHSLLQLYLDGPKNNFFTFFSVFEKKSPKISNKYLLNNDLNIKNKSFYEILTSQKKATVNVFKKKKIPFRDFEVLNRSEETLGELFTFFILETILLGRLIKVNPLDQPSVEQIKIETKKILIK